MPINKLYNKIKEILSPYYCYNCKKFLDYGYICDKCLEKIGFKLEIYCLKCKRRKPYNEKITSTCCSTLIKSLITFSDYTENKVVSDLIKIGKIYGYRKIFEFFGNLISREMKKLDSINFDFLKNCKIAYIPLTKKVERLRGFNQAKILADVLSKEFGIEIFDGLIKIKDTKLQTELSFEERFKNIESAFESIKQSPKNLILIDDVVTTGATLLEASKKLKERGAKNIVALTIAK
ncbi:MAG: ComF family protein [Minisyncoccia bacterium]